MAHLNHKKKTKFLAEAAFWFPHVKAWHFVRKAGRWTMKMDRADPAGHTPQQKVRTPRRLK